jgi:hypothetical protein
MRIKKQKMKSFKQFLKESILDRFKEEHYDVPKIGKGHNVNHDEIIGDKQVSTKFMGVNGHYSISFDVNGSMHPDLNSNPLFGAHLFNHQRKVIETFIDHFKPKSLEFSAIHPGFNEMYNKFSQHLSHKYNMKHEYDKDVGSHYLFGKK